MTDTTFDSFTLTRRLAAPPARVFRAFAVEAQKDKWFSGPPGAFTVQERSFDFRIGGIERQAGRWTGGPTSDFTGLYHDIVPDSRIVMSYDMLVGGTRISASLLTITLAPDGTGTTLTLTEQGVYLNGFEDKGGRREGTAAILDALADSLAPAEELAA